MIEKAKSILSSVFNRIRSAGQFAWELVVATYDSLPLTIDLYRPLGVRMFKAKKLTPKLLQNLEELRDLSIHGMEHEERIMAMRAFLKCARKVGVSEQALRIYGRSDCNWPLFVRMVA